MKAAKKRGPSSTARGLGTEHRRLRLVVLERDGWRCQRPVAGGRVCGKPANQAGHIVARANGGTSTLGNLRAECGDCNSADGGRIGAAIRARRRVPSFFSDGPALGPLDGPGSLPTPDPPDPNRRNAGNTARSRPKVTGHE